MATTINPAGEFGHTFLDIVHIPAEAILGQVNGGWEAFTASLGAARGVLTAMIIAKMMHAFEQVCAYVRAVEVDGKRLMPKAPVTS